MLRVLIWNENVQEHWDQPMENAVLRDPERMKRIAEQIREIHPRGIHGTLSDIVKEMEGVEVRTATLDSPECGLSDSVLDETDVLIWWGHVAHDRLPDVIAEKIQNHVLRGMGFIALHSAHLCKPLKRLLGTSLTLKWREGDFCRVWTVDPTHPIARGIPESFELEEEEMYGEFFDIPKPDSLIFLNWNRGGEVFRSGCAWERGYGKVFYFQPGHETNRSYLNPSVRAVIQNAVRWAAPTRRIGALECPNILASPELRHTGKAGSIL